MGILDEQSGGGKFEIKIQLSKPPNSSIAIFTIEAPTSEQAKQEAIIKAREKWKTVPEPKSILVLEMKNLWSKAQGDLMSGGMDNTLGNISVAVDGLSNSKEFKEIITSFKKLEKLMDNPGFKKIVGKVDDFGNAIPKGVSKALGPIGKGFSALDVFTEFRKIAGYFDRLLGTADKDLIKKLVHDITLSFAKITKTIVATAIPVVGLIDFGASVVMLAYGAVSDMVVEQKDAVKRAQYDQQNGALKPGNWRYETEWRLYASGISMADILEIRSHLTDWMKRGASDEWLTLLGLIKKDSAYSHIGDNKSPSSAPAAPAKTFTVNYNTDGGVPGFPPKTVKFNDANLLPASNPARKGFDFNGWNVTLGGYGNNVSNSNPYSSLATSENSPSITLKAQWTLASAAAPAAPSNVTVSFNTSGGTPNPASKSVTVDSAYGTLPAVTKAGYNFEGWFDAASGGTKVEPSTKVANRSAHTLFARWAVPGGVTVTFDSKGGSTPNPASKSAIPDSTYGPLPAVARDGYKFEGWFTAASGGAKIESSTKVTNRSAHTLFARWTAINVTVAFNINGGKPPTPLNKILPFDSNYGSLPTAARDGYKFDGWYTAATGGTKIEPSTKVDNKNTHTLFARWAGNNVTVNFHRNGGTSDAIPAVTVVYNSRVTMPASPARPDFTFESWNTKADGTGTVFNANTPVTANIDVYAKWKAIPPKMVAVIFNANGGSAPNPARKDIAAGSACGTLPPATTRAGSVFDSWNTKPDGSGTAFTANTPVDAPITVYAKWKTNTYTVTFHRNGATGDAIPQIQAAHNSRITLPAPPTRPDYTFECWNTKADGTGTVFNAGTPVTADIEVYAKWKAAPPKVVTITFNANGGSPNSTRQVTVGTALGTLPTVTRAGYKFVGWYNAASGGGMINSTDPISGNYPTFYAYWSANTYTVTFHRNGAENSSPAIPQIQAVQNSKITLPAPPTRPDYTFEGWNTKADGSGTVFNANTPVTADIGVYAKWKANAPKVVTITFNANGGSPNSTRQVTIGTALGTLPSVSRNGYTFDGWFNAASGGGKINSTDPITGNYPTFYAHWTAVPTPQPAPQPAPPPPPPPPSTPKCTVTFHRNGAENYNSPIPQVTADCNSRISLPSSPNWPGHTFTGWNTSGHGTGSAFTGDIPNTSALAVYAIWREDAPAYQPPQQPASNTMTVYFDSNGGSPPNPSSRQLVVNRDRIGPLPTVTKPGYIFDGWFTPSGTKLTADHGFSGSYTTIIAHWRK